MDIADIHTEKKIQVHAGTVEVTLVEKKMNHAHPGKFKFKAKSSCT